MVKNTTESQPNHIHPRKLRTNREPLYVWLLNYEYPSNTRLHIRHIIITFFLQNTNIYVTNKLRPCSCVCGVIPIVDYTVDKIRCVCNIDTEKKKNAFNMHVSPTDEEYGHTINKCSVSISPIFLTRQLPRCHRGHIPTL